MGKALNINNDYSSLVSQKSQTPSHLLNWSYYVEIAGFVYCENNV